MPRHVAHLSYLAPPTLWIHNMNSCLVDAPLSNLVSLPVNNLTSFPGLSWVNLPTEHFTISEYVHWSLWTACNSLIVGFGSFKTVKFLVGLGRWDELPWMVGATSQYLLHTVALIKIRGNKNRQKPDRAFHESRKLVSISNSIKSAFLNLKWGKSWSWGTERHPSKLTNVVPSSLICKQTARPSSYLARPNISQL